MHTPRTLRLVAALAITLLGLSTAGVAQARWPARADRQLTLTTNEDRAELRDACTDGSGGAYLTWREYSVPQWPDRIRHLGSFGDDVFNSITWAADSMTGSVTRLAPDGAGGVLALSERFPAPSFERIVTVTSIGARGNRLGVAALAPAGFARGDMTAECLVKDPDGPTCVAVWNDDFNASTLLRAQCCNSAGQPLWSDTGVVVTSRLHAPCISGLVADGRGGWWLAVVCFPGGITEELRVQHIDIDGTPEWPDTGIVIATSSGVLAALSLSSDGSGGIYLASYRDSGSNWVQRIRPNGTFAFGPNGVALPGPDGAWLGGATLGQQVGGRLVAMWASYEAQQWQTRAQMLDSTGTWIWPGAGVLAGRAYNDMSHHVFANADGGATVAVPTVGQVPAGVGGGAQRFGANGLLLWPTPTPIFMVASWDQLQDLYGRSCYVPTGEGGVMYFTALRDSGLYVSGNGCIRAQHLDAHGRLGDTSPRIASVRDVPGDLGGTLEVRWKASCLEGDSTMATVAYDVLRQQPDGAGGTTLAVVGTLTATGDSEYVAQVPTLADSTSPGAAPTVLRVRARDASGREWLSPPAAGASYANGPLGVGPDATATLSLSAPSPSPASSRTQVRYTLAAAGHVSLELLDVAGRRVHTLAAGAKPAGPHAETLELRDDAGRRLPSGLYFVRLTTAGRCLTRRLVVLL